MKKIKTEDALGHILCHDHTQIVKDDFKGVRFKKGHVVREEDIPVLLDMGKKHLFVWEAKEGFLHEDEAVAYLERLAKGDHIETTTPREGKVDGIAGIDGLLKVDVDRLFDFNLTDQVMMATRHNNMPVKKGDKVFGTRVIPLQIDQKILEDLEERMGAEPLIHILPYQVKTAGIVSTGSEVADGRIADTFSQVMRDKCQEFNIDVINVLYPGDDQEKISKSIEQLLEEGAEIVICTGGMSVDPDDCTKDAIRESVDQFVVYGSPVLPGAMFALGYMEEGQAVVGIPACGMYNKRTILDIIFPRLIAKDPVSARDIAALGHGGLCLHCPVCTFPECSFGKGA